MVRMKEEEEWVDYEEGIDTVNDWVGNEGNRDIGANGSWGKCVLNGGIHDKFPSTRGGCKEGGCQLVLR